MPEGAVAEKPATDTTGNAGAGTTDAGKAGTTDAAKTGADAGKTGATDTGKTDATGKSILGPDASKTGEAGKTDVKSAAPEKYADFKLPEGLPKEISLDKEALAKVTPLFKEAGLSQEHAQKLVDFQANLQADVLKKQVAAIEAQNVQWVSELKTAFGAEFDKQSGLAAKGIEALGGAELRTFLHQSGLGNFPLLVKAFAKYGAEISEGHPTEKVRNENGQPKSDGEVLYPAMKDHPDGIYRGK